MGWGGKQSAHQWRSVITTSVLEKTDYVKNGDIVVALIDSQEATLKRIRKKSNAIALEPANKNFETRIFGPKRITIQGKLVGIIRNY